MTIEVFPTVGGVSVGFDGEWLEITQSSMDGSEDQVVIIPNRFVDAFLAAINRAMGGE